MNETYRCIDPQRDGDWLTLWLDRPEARNALSEPMIGELSRVLSTCHEDRSLRGITIRGRGGLFCAGGDLKAFKAVFQDEGAQVTDVAAANRRGGELFERINRQPQVVLMLVEGAAMAGGLGMLCAADLVAVTADARFALTETTLGIPPAQIAPYVAERLGLPAARRLMLTAQRFDGREAGRLGLADFVVDDAEALERIEAQVRDDVRRCAPGANARTKDILLAARHLDREAMLDYAAAGFAQAMISDEGREGIAAFVEKRRPSWAPAREHET